MSFSAHPLWPRLQSLWRRGTDFLGTETAILGGAMSWISHHGLVAAISQAGGFGVIASGPLSPEDLEKEIRLTQERTQRPFGVNLIVFHPHYQAMADVCRRTQVSHVFLGGGLPSKESITFLRNHHIRVVAFTPTVNIGQRLINMGVEALVLEGTEAGGHVGPVATSVLAQEILPVLRKQVPIFMAGGIGTGEAIASHILNGADGCQMGTRFVCAQESCAHPHFKEAFIRAASRDAVLSLQLDPRFPVIPVRALDNTAMKNFLQTQRDVMEAVDAQTLTPQEAKLKIELFWAGALRRGVVEGDVDHGSLMAGQSVGLVDAVEPVKTIIDRLLAQILHRLETLWPQEDTRTP